MITIPQHDPYNSIAEFFTYIYNRGDIAERGTPCKPTVGQSMWEDRSPQSYTADHVQAGHRPPRKHSQTLQTQHRRTSIIGGSPLRPEESTQFLSFIFSETPIRFFLTTSLPTEFRPCFLMSILPPLERAMTDERAEVAAIMVTKVEDVKENY